MSATYTFLASQVPPPQAISGALLFSNGETPLQTPGLVTGLNPDMAALVTQLARTIDILHSYGGVGLGILNGLEVSAGSGLTVAISSGQALISGAMTYPGGTKTVNASQATNFVWLLANGNITVETDLTVPAGPCVLLAVVSTSSSAVTQVDYSGRCYFDHGNMYRDIIGGAPDDTPPSVRCFTRCVDFGHVYLSDGDAYHEFVHPSGQVASAVLIKALTSDFNLTLSHPPILRLDGGASDRKVLMPDPTTLPYWWQTSIENLGATNVLNVRDHADTTTLISVATGSTSTPIKVHPFSGGYHVVVTQDL